MSTDAIHTDKELLRLVAAGDEQAFAVLFNQYTALLHPYILRIIKSETLTEEIIQETFIRIWLKRDQLPDIENPRSWIFTVAANQCFNVLRQQLKQQKLLKQVSQTENNSMILPFETTDRQELRKAIQNAVNLLSPQRKRIWQLSREQGIKQAEIATLLNISLPTVKNTLAQSLVFIRKQLEEQGYLLTPAMLALCLYL